MLGDLNTVIMIEHVLMHKEQPGYMQSHITPGGGSSNRQDNGDYNNRPALKNIGEEEEEDGDDDSYQTYKARAASSIVGG